MRHKAHVFRMVDGEQQALMTSPPPAVQGGPRPEDEARARAQVRPPRGAPEATSELRHKLAWAVGSTYRVPYTKPNTWASSYARQASLRLVEIHGPPP